MRFALVAFALPFVFADVQFVAPAAGGYVPAGSINAVWQESEKMPLIADLTQYSLALMVGGNEDDNMLSVATFVSQGDFTTSSNATGTISSGITGDVPNGFFFKITSAAAAGGNVTNYSDRFTITGLTGQVDSTYRDAAVALDGDTKGPSRVVDVPGITPSASASSTSTNSQQTVTITSIPGSQPPASASAGAPGRSPIASVGSDNSDTGKIAGGVIAGVVVLAALIAICVWAFCRRKKREGVKEIEYASKDTTSRLSLRHQVSTTALSELGADGRVLEIGDGIRRPEMESSNIRAELAGDYLHQPREMEGSPVISPISRHGTLRSPVTPVDSFEAPWTPIDGGETLPTYTVGSTWTSTLRPETPGSLTYENAVTPAEKV